MPHQTQIGIYAPLSAIESEIEPNEDALVSLLAKLDRDDTLLHCGVINAIVTGPGVSTPFQRQQKICSKICTPADGSKLNAFMKANGGPAHVTVFFRGQVLELIRWASKHCPSLPESGNSFSTFDTCHTFMRAALIASEIWGKRVYADRLSGEGELATARERALGAFRKGVEDSGSATHMGVAFGRGKLLFCDYLPKRYPGFRDAFVQATGLTIEQFLVSVGILIPYAGAEPREGHIFRTGHVAGETAYSELFANFNDLLSITPERIGVELWDDFDRVGFKALREHPVLAANGGRGIVLDPTYLMDCLTIGPLFRVVSAAKSRDVNQIFGAFGDAFEDYVQNILKRIYPERAPLAKQLYLGEKSPAELSPAFEIDVAINSAVDLVVMEAKAVFIREAEILTDDPQRFIEELRAKYAKPSDPKARVKGVAQLARSIGAIVREEWTGLDIAPEHLKTIHPVLLVHDDRLSSPGANAFFEGEFRELLGEHSGKYWVAPVTVMTISDLENIESSHSLRLIELLNAFTKDQPDGGLTLHDYMALSPRFSAKIKPNDTLIAESAALVDMMKSELFPALDNAV